MGWWILWWALFLIASFVVLVLYRVTHRTFVIWALCSGVVFFAWGWATNTFPDLRRVLPRALHDWQFIKATRMDPAAMEARKIVEEDCRDDETAETTRLNRDLQKYRDLRAKNGVLSADEEKGREQVLNRLAEIEKKKAACVARVVPAPRSEQPAPVPAPIAVSSPALAATPSIRRARAASTVPPPPEPGATRISPVPRVVGGNLRHAIDLTPGEWLNIREAIRQSCTYWRIESAERLWLWFEDGGNAGRVLAYEKDQRYDRPPSAIRGDGPMAATIVLTPLNEPPCAGYWAKGGTRLALPPARDEEKGGTWQPLPEPREAKKGAARVEPLPEASAPR